MLENVGEFIKEGQLGKFEYVCMYVGYHAALPSSSSLPPTIWLPTPLI